MPGRHPVVRRLVAIAAAIVAAACGEPPTAVVIRPGDFDVVASEPRLPVVTGLSPNPIRTSGKRNGEGIGFVSLPPQSVAAGHSATIRNLSSRYETTTDVVDGGFDPVPVPAAVGDSIEVVITDSSGGATRVMLAVPVRKPPVVIRTVPPRRSTDVPLNSLIRVVFSEPMDPRSLTTTTVRLLRGGIVVAGQVMLSADGLRADFVPDSLLAPETSYELEVAAAASDANGERMDGAVSVAFLTGPGAAAVARVVVDPASVTLALAGQVTLSAQAVDAQGRPIARSSSWSIANPTVATITPTGVVTGVSAGTTTATATVDGRSGTSTITVVSAPGGLTVLPAGGDLQSDTIFATLNPFRVQVLRDGAPAPGVRVWWSHERSGSIRATSLTDDSGLASYVLRLGPSTCSSVGSMAPGVFITSENTFLAAVPGASGSPAAFRSLTRAGNPTGLEASATGDRGFPVGTRQVVQRGGTVTWAAMIVDAQGNPVDRAGTAVQWTVTSGGGTVDPGSSLTQDSYPCGFGGVTSTRHTPGPGVGEQQVVATLAGVAAAPVSYTTIAVDTIVEVLGDGVAQFAEDSLSLPVGVTVGWNWVCEPGDTQAACSAHNVTFEDQPAAPTSSGTFVNGEHVRQFSTPGVYRYRCTNHSSSFRSGMVGMVVVR